MSLFLSYVIIQREPTKRILLKDVFISKLRNNPLAFCSFINLDLLISHAKHFHKNIILRFFVFTTFGFLLSAFFLRFKQYNNIVL